MGIGSILQNLIQARGTNVNAISSATGVNPQTIYSIIKRDSTKADIGDLYQIAHHLGVDLNYFYKGYDISALNTETASAPMQAEENETATTLTQEEKENQLAAMLGDELWDKICKDKTKYALMQWISNLNEEQLDRVEKLLDAALLLPRE